MLDRLQAHLAFRLQHALYLIGEEAGRNGDPRIKADCEELAAKIGDVKIRIDIPAAHIMCQACDEMRRRGDDEAVAELEKLVQVLKGNVPRKIVGTFQYDAKSIAQIDDTLEKLRKTVVANSGG